MADIKDKNRLKEIARLRLHEEQADKILDEYVKKAAEEFNLPIGLVSVVMDDSQYFAAAHGLDGWLKAVGGTPVEWSFCAHSVKSEAPFIVEDAKTNSIVKNNPLVTIDNIQCYAGAPMTTKNGIVLGNFCVIGDKSRKFSEKEINKLKEYASKVVDRLEERVK